MAEPKGGPVKPPTLDLKPSRKSASRSATRRPASRPGAPGKAGSNPEKAGTSGKTAPQKSGTKGRNAETDAARREKSASRPESESARPASSSGQTASIRSNAPGGNLLGILLGALGGALLAILVLVPLILSGILQPGGQRALEADTARLDRQIGLNQEQTGEILVGFRAMNEQMDQFRLEMSAQQDELRNDLEQAGQLRNALRDQLDAVVNRQERLEEQTTALDAGLQQALARLDARDASPFDPAPLNEKIQALSARLDAVAAGASSDDAERLAADIAAIRSEMQTALQALDERIEKEISPLSTSLNDTATGIKALALRLDALEEEAESRTALITRMQEELSGLETHQALLRQELETVQQAALPPEPETEEDGTSENPGDAAGSALQARIALVSLELALNSARPFESELASLEAAHPGLAVSPQLRQAATGGLTPPGKVIADFDAALPAMLAARPADPDAGWSERTLQALKSLLALRPTQATSADPLDNLVARTEQAVSRADFATAADLIELLPDPMHQALGSTATDIQLSGEAQKLLERLRPASTPLAATGPDAADVDTTRTGTTNPNASDASTSETSTSETGATSGQATQSPTAGAGESQ